HRTKCGREWNRRQRKQYLGIRDVLEDQLADAGDALFGLVERAHSKFVPGRIVESRRDCAPKNAVGFFVKPNLGQSQCDNKNVRLQKYSSCSLLYLFVVSKRLCAKPVPQVLRRSFIFQRPLELLKESVDINQSFSH